MGEERIFLSELFLLMIWLCLPAQLVALVAQVIFFKRRSVLHSGRSGRALVGLIITFLATLALALPLWLALPRWLLPAIALPGGSLGWVPPFFLPSVLVCVIVAPLLAVWVTRPQRRL